MTKEKLLYGALSGAASLAFALTPVLASASNDTTGYNSNNTAETSVENKIYVDQTNNASITNNISVKSNTGYNEANKNTGEGIVDTGDASATVAISNTANGNTLNLENCGGCAGDVDASNTKTGADSYNKAEAEVENKVDVDQTNNADVDNNVSVKSNTGGNEANKNTGEGSVDTGDASAVVSIANMVNENKLSLGGGDGGSISASNDTTGADSYNKAEAEVENKVYVDQTNNADIDNNVEIVANTGYNEANKNTGEGSIDTGDADVELAIENTANSNEADLDVCCDVELDASNEKTGADSYNKAEAEVENKVDVDQTNNADVDNNGELKANTGHNETNKNTADDQNTGDADVDVEIDTTANSNSINGDTEDSSGVDVDVEVNL